jgi:hypothetical protein
MAGPEVQRVPEDRVTRSSYLLPDPAAERAPSSEAQPSAAAEPVLQRVPAGDLEPAEPGAAPTAPGTDATSSGAVATASPAGPTNAAANLDELARRLYEPLAARLRAELWLDRERTGRSLTR